MSAKLLFDNRNQVQPFTIILSRKDFSWQGQLNHVTQVVYKPNLNGADYLSFTLYKGMNDEIDPLWDEVRNFKLIYVKELEEYFELTFDLEDSREQVVKNVTCISLCEAELGQLLLRNLEINTEDDIDRDDYDENNPTIFYNPTLPSSSLLHRVLHDKAPHYLIGHVDDTLKNIQRTFSCDSKSIYDFLTEDVASEIGCLFVFDSTKREINVYDLNSVCLNNYCDYYINEDNLYHSSGMRTFRYRGEFTDKCPICESTEIDIGYGNDTSILVDKENLTDEIRFTTDTDATKNVFVLESSDDDFDAAIRSINPAGTNYIMRFNDEMLSDMPTDLVSKLKEYEQACESAKPKYREAVLNYYESITDEAKLRHSMMPEPLDVDKRIGKDADGVIGDSWSVLNELKQKITNNEVGIHVSDSYTFDKAILSGSTVNNAIKMYAATFIWQQYFSIDVLDNATFGIIENFTRDGKTYQRCTWTGTLIVKKYSDTNDYYPERITEMEYHNLSNSDKASGMYYFVDNNENIGGNPLKITLVISNDDYTYIMQRVSKEIMSNAKQQKNINNYYQMVEFVLVNSDGTPNTIYQGEYKKALKLYSLEYLKTLLEGAESCRAILIASGQGEPTAEYYNWYKYQYCMMVDLIDTEIITREEEIKILVSNSKMYLSQMYTIRRGLILSNYDDVWTDKTYSDKKIWLTDEQYLTLCSFRREDVYSNDNFISDGLDDNELLEMAEEYYELAEKELFKASTQQHSISSTLANLLVMEEFRPIIKYFELGNYIRIRVEDKIYRLRLVSYELDFDNLGQLTVEFSDMTQTAYGYNDISNVINAVNSMSTSYGVVQKQTSKGTQVYDVLEEFRSSGVDTALYNIKTNDNEEVKMTSKGLLARSYDDTSNNYLSEQFLITHNTIAFTTDNWNTVSSALGKFTYKTSTGKTETGYGLNAKFVNAGTIWGSEIIGGEIFSTPDEAGKHSSYINLETGAFWFGDPGETKSQGISFNPNTGELVVYGKIYASQGSELTNSSSVNQGTFRGSVYATDGEFQGKVIATSGSLFKGIIESNFGVLNGQFTLGGMYTLDNTEIVGNISGSLSISALLSGTITGNSLTINDVGVTGTFSHSYSGKTLSIDTGKFNFLSSSNNVGSIYSAQEKYDLSTNESIDSLFLNGSKIVLDGGIAVRNNSSIANADTNYVSGYTGIINGCKFIDGICIGINND